jgi:hypothetical protein
MIDHYKPHVSGIRSPARWCIHLFSTNFRPPLGNISLWSNRYRRICPWDRGPWHDINLVFPCNSENWSAIGTTSAPSCALTPWCEALHLPWGLGLLVAMLTAVIHNPHALTEVIRDSAHIATCLWGDFRRLSMQNPQLILRSTVLLDKLIVTYLTNFQVFLLSKRLKCDFVFSQKNLLHILVFLFNSLDKFRHSFLFGLWDFSVESLSLEENPSCLTSYASHSVLT